eukprot:403357503
MFSDKFSLYHLPNYAKLQDENSSQHISHYQSMNQSNDCYFNTAPATPTYQDFLTMGNTKDCQPQYTSQESNYGEFIVRQTLSQSPPSGSEQTYQVKDVISPIRDVWVHNFFDELAILASYIESSYNIIAFDTEFPGILIEKSTFFKGKTLQKPFYQWIKENVDSSKVIQLGISISNEDEEQPFPVSTWQFNFQFDKNQDIYNQESIELLENAGLNFSDHERNGIPHNTFAEYAFGSGLLLNSSLKWVAFNSAFDFGYLLKMFTQFPLPNTEEEFLQQVQLYFPVYYDVKHLRSDGKDLNSQIRNEQIYREGVAHQAGSDSLVTLQLYHKSMKDPIYKKQNLQINAKNVIYRLGDFYRREESKDQKLYYQQKHKLFKEAGRKSELVQSRRHIDDYVKPVKEYNRMVVNDDQKVEESQHFYDQQSNILGSQDLINNFNTGLNLAAPEFQSKYEQDYFAKKAVQQQQMQKKSASSESIQFNPLQIQNPVIQLQPQLKQSYSAPVQQIVIQQQPGQRGYLQNNHNTQQHAYQQLQKQLSHNYGNYQKVYGIQPTNWNVALNNLALNHNQTVQKQQHQQFQQMPLNSQQNYVNSQDLYSFQNQSNIPLNYQGQGHIPLMYQTLLQNQQQYIHNPNQCINFLENQYVPQNFNDPRQMIMQQHNQIPPCLSFNPTAKPFNPQNNLVISPSGHLVRQQLYSIQNAPPNTIQDQTSQTGCINPSNAISLQQFNCQGQQNASQNLLINQNNSTQLQQQQIHQVPNVQPQQSMPSKNGLSSQPTMI